MNATPTKVLLAMLCLLLTSRLAAQPKEENPVCLEVFGLAISPNQEAIDGVNIKLFKENDELEWTEITSVLYHDHSFSFKLEANAYYTIEVSKPGYVNRSVGISTHIPSGVSLKQVFTYEFEVEMFPEKKEVDDYYMDFPVALISYNKKADVFDNNNAYTNHIKTKIKESQKEAENKKLVNHN